MNGTTYSQPALTSFGAAYERVTAALRAHGSRGHGNTWQCPAHDDQHPSLSVNQGEGKVLLYCHVCGRDATEIIVKAIGLEMHDLFDDSSAGQVDRVCTMMERMAHHAFTGRTALTDRDVLLAVVKLAREHGSLCVICASRVISELSGVHHDTALASLKRLAGKEILLYAGKASGGASRYELAHNPTVFYQPGASISPFHVNTVGKRAASEQAAPFAPTNQGITLTKRGMLVWCALADDPMTDQEIAEQTGIPRSTVNRILRIKLARLEYAIKTPDGWIKGYHVYNPDTDNFAGHIAEDRKARHQRERKQIARVRKARKYREDAREMPGDVSATPDVARDSSGDFTGYGVDYIRALQAREVSL